MQPSVNPRGMDGVPSANKGAYPESPERPDFPAIEEAVLDFWDADGTFKASVEGRPARTADGASNEFVFYDGPPFANGLPHYGHLLTGFAKDIVPRFQTMLGRRVERRFGWDCHGLPAEMEAEKQLGVSGRVAIEAYGVDRFNHACRALVSNTADQWRFYVRRQARWVDMDRAYRTMDLPYMESVIWAFKRLYDKGLIYEGFRVLPYCWECETPLSNFETRQDDAYRERVDPAVFVRFPLRQWPLKHRYPDASLVIWTTTPWTLPSNLAVAVNEAFSYAVAEAEGRHLVVAEELAGTLSEELGVTLRVVDTLPGKDLVGSTYSPPFDFFSDVPGAFRVLAADFVTLEEGSGIVHLAPGFGEEDQMACEAASIPVVCPVDERGRFTQEVPPYAGMQVFEANERIIADLSQAGLLLARHDYPHSYPHCWRTDTPLIYRAVSSWFLRVTAIKDRLIKANEEIEWIPEHIKEGAFGNWLRNARDWSISRNRFWGAPIPVWKSDDPRYPRIDVYGSLDELERDFGVRPSDLHRPEIDALTRPNPDDPTGRSRMRRVAEVLDCWFESGSMPFAAVHYPFENTSWFEEHFPADWIVEYIGQVRGWFYTLHVIGVALFDRPAFRTCLTHGVILGNDGRKLSKRLRNYPDPEEVFSKWGADAMRWAMVSGPALRGQDFVIDEKGFEQAVKQVLNPLYNAWHFLSLYSRADGMVGTYSLDSPNVLDRYILAKCADLYELVTNSLARSDLSSACRAIEDTLEALTNWYIRRSRDRFWRSVKEGDIEDKVHAYNTLHTVLATLCKLAAPLMPLLTEHVYKNLTGARSVHLEPWPRREELLFDKELVRSMEVVRQICSAGHSIRKSAGVRARVPLSKARVVVPDPQALVPYRELIADELNVKDVELTSDATGVASFKLKVVPSLIGPRLGADTAKVLRAARDNLYELTPEGTVRVAGIDLLPEEATLEWEPEDASATRVIPEAKAAIWLDLTLTDDLVKEGLARDAVRLVQNLRKDAGLDVTDRIVLRLWSPDPSMVEAIRAHLDYIARETLASEVELGGEALEGALVDETRAASHSASLRIQLKKAP